MKNILLFILISLFQGIGFAQTRQPAGKLDINTAPLGIVKQIKELQPISTSGSFYINDDWRQCHVRLKNGESGSVSSCKYNLETSHLEIKIDNETKALDLRYIEEFFLVKDRTDTLVFKNAYNNYSIEEIPVVGIIEVLVEGENTLVSKPILKIQKANYIPALDTGEKSDKYIKQEQLFLVRGSKLYPIKSKKGDWLNELGNHKNDIEEFAKRSKLGFRKKEDLIKIIRYSNELK